MKFDSPWVVPSGREATASGCSKLFRLEHCWLAVAMRPTYLGVVGACGLPLDGTVVAGPPVLDGIFVHGGFLYIQLGSVGDWGSFVLKLFVGSGRFLFYCNSVKHLEVERGRV